MRRVFDMDIKEMAQKVATPGVKVAVIMAAAVFAVMLFSFLWGPASRRGRHRFWFPASGSRALTRETRRSPAGNGVAPYRVAGCIIGGCRAGIGIPPPGSRKGRASQKRKNGKTERGTKKGKGKRRRRPPAGFGREGHSFFSASFLSQPHFLSSFLSFFLNLSKNPMSFISLGG